LPKSRSKSIIFFKVFFFARNPGHGSPRMIGFRFRRQPGPPPLSITGFLRFPQSSAGLFPPKGSVDFAGSPHKGQYLFSNYFVFFGDGSTIRQNDG
jgi:hypothetical protein